jgi:hypothetical protein
VNLIQEFFAFKEPIRIAEEIIVMLIIIVNIRLALQSPGLMRGADALHPAYLSVDPNPVTGFQPPMELIDK